MARPDLVVDTTTRCGFCQSDHVEVRCHWCRMKWYCGELHLRHDDANHRQECADYANADPFDLTRESGFRQAMPPNWELMDWRAAQEIMPFDMFYDEYLKWRSHWDMLRACYLLTIGTPKALRRSLRSLEAYPDLPPHMINTRVSKRLLPATYPRLGRDKDSLLALQADLTLSNGTTFGGVDPFQSIVFGTDIGSLALYALHVMKCLQALRNMNNASIIYKKLPPELLIEIQKVMMTPVVANIRDIGRKLGGYQALAPYVLTAMSQLKMTLAAVEASNPYLLMVFFDPSLFQEKRLAVWNHIHYLPCDNLLLHDAMVAFWDVYAAFRDTSGAVEWLKELVTNMLSKEVVAARVADIKAAITPWWKLELQRIAENDCLPSS